MFDSLKKKFSKAIGKIEDSVIEEEEKKGNIEIIEAAESIKNSELESETENNTETESKSILEPKSGYSSSIIEEKENKETNDDEEKIDNEEEGEEKEENREKKGFFTSLRKKSKKEEERDEGDVESSDNLEKQKCTAGFLSFIKEKTISEKDIDDILWELEMSLLESDVAIEVANTIVESVKKELVGLKVKRSTEISDYTLESLRKAVREIIDVGEKSVSEILEEKKTAGEPLIIMFVGINGTGKTTTIAKVANYFMKKGYNPVVAASDTFRAGAIEQITHHADNLEIKIIKHQKGSDPAAVAYDAVEHAKAKGKELVLIDTAGRMQTNTNLMDEMKKIKRVSKLDMVIFVGDALTGNDAVEQATKFNEAVDVDGVILTKVDADSKGGAALSIGYVIQKPIVFLGVGQGYDDLIEYDPDWMLEQIFS